MTAPTVSPAIPTAAAGRPAPVADWVTIPELYTDPFPSFERLRAEGGVHWVPAIGRYLITSYDAVHDTELDQETFSANEQGSLMIRAMGHSMLRKDDPEHHLERRAWQPALKPSAIKKTWRAVFERTAHQCLQDFQAKGPGADLVWDFAAPYAAESLRAVTGLHNVTAADLQRWSQTMIDATGNYADDPEVWAKGEASYREVDAALDEMLAWHARFPDDSLISALLAMPDYAMPLESIRANLKMTIGGGLNEPRDAIGVAAWALLSDPAQHRMVTEDPSLWDAVFDEAIRWVAPIGMYSRQTTRDTVLQGVHLPTGAKLGISLLSANRDETKWTRPERFDLSRPAETPHLAFGKGVHVCLGAWVARAEVADIALPLLFSSLPNLRLDPDRPAEAGGWVFRGMDRLPVLWDAPPSTTTIPTTAASSQRVATAPAEPARGPRVAVVGSGPSGCYTAQAVRKRFPGAEIAVIDRHPFPFGLVRFGVAPDHQGTKAVSEQFARLFERDGVEFVGSVRVGSGPEDNVSLAQLREAFDAVVLATGLHQDARLEVPGADLSGVHGAGRITRLLNSAADEVRPAPSLGATAAVVGMGNVAMDLVRLLASASDQLEGSDVCDETHAALTESLQTLHVVGRSLPEQAKFDPVMLREILDLPGVDHVVHGVDAAELAVAGDARSELVAEMLRRGADAAPEPRVRVEWWFDRCPERIVGVEGGAEDGRVTGMHLRPTGSDASVQELSVDSVITAVGFCAGDAQQLVDVDESAQQTGRVEPGLYVAGWARRGPRGTIPSQRTDAQELAEVIEQDLSARDESGSESDRTGLAGLADALSGATDYATWQTIDAHETRHAAEGRVRRKITDPQELRIVTRGAFGIPAAALSSPIPADGEGSGSGEGPSSGCPFSGGGLPSEPVTILFGTESGNAELVAEELAGTLGRAMDVRTVDLGRASVADLDPARLHLVVCSTYGDGELPTSVRGFHAELGEQRPDLSGVRFAVFGLGDRSYAHTYSRGSEILDETFRDLGAQRVGEYGRHDAGGRDLAPALALQWAMGVLHDLARQPASA